MAWRKIKCIFEEKRVRTAIQEVPKHPINSMQKNKAGWLTKGSWPWSIDGFLLGWFGDMNYQCSVIAVRGKHEWCEVAVIPSLAGTVPRSFLSCTDDKWWVKMMASKLNVKSLLLASKHVNTTIVIVMWPSGGCYSELNVWKYCATSWGQKSIFTQSTPTQRSLL